MANPVLQSALVKIDKFVEVNSGRMDTSPFKKTSLSALDLHREMNIMGVRITKAEAAEFVRHYDLDKDGKIDRAEFQRGFFNKVQRKKSLQMLKQAAIDEKHALLRAQRNEIHHQTRYALQAEEAEHSQLDYDYHYQSAAQTSLTTASRVGSDYDAVPPPLPPPPPPLPPQASFRQQNRPPVPSNRMSGFDDYETRELLGRLQVQLGNAQTELRASQHRVARLTTQVHTVARQLGLKVVSMKGPDGLPVYAQSGPEDHKPPAKEPPVTPGVLQPGAAAAAAAAEAAAKAKAANTLPDGWESFLDVPTGKTYYFHPSTNTVQWAHPTSSTPSQALTPVAQVPPTAVPLPSSSVNGSASHHNIENVFDRLTDTRYYTGSSRARFDENGNGSPNTRHHTAINRNEAGGEQYDQFDFNHVKSDHQFHDASEVFARNSFSPDHHNLGWR